MQLTKHAHARFKQRHKIKNNAEMRRKAELALRRGEALPSAPSSDIVCYLFDGFEYVFAKKGKSLVTLFPCKRRLSYNRRRLLEALRLKQFATDAEVEYTY